MRFSRVDFPHPEGPITATNSPPSTVRSIPRSARTGAPSASMVSKVRLRPRTCNPAKGVLLSSTCINLPRIAPALSPATTRSDAGASTRDVVVLDPHLEGRRPEGCWPHLVGVGATLVSRADSWQSQSVNSEKQVISVFLADDNLIVREGVKALLDLEDDFDIVGVAADYDELVTGAEAAQPQVS